MKQHKTPISESMQEWFSLRELESVDASIATPLYHQLYILLRSRIIDGVIGDGARLPTEQELAEAFDVSRITAKRAMQGLVADGLAQRRRGRGSYATHIPAHAVDVPVTGLLENLVSLNKRMTVSVLELDQAPAPAALRAEADLAPHERVCRVTRTRSNESGQPFAWYMSWTTGEAAASHFTKQALELRPRLEILLEHGIVVERAEQDLFAGGASEAAAQALDLVPGDPVLKVERRCYDSAGHCLDWLRGEYHPLRFRYRMSLSPTSGSQPLHS